MTPNFVIALSYHHADAEQATKLAKLMADIEPSYRDDILVLLVRRFDTIQPLEMLEAIAKKFPVATFKTTTPWTGWPAGCNAVAMDTIGYAQRCYYTHLGFGPDSWANVRGVLLMEPDCVPCTSDWLNRIIAEWGRASEGTLQMGAWRPSGGEHGHINGCCVLPPDFFGHVSSEVIGPDLAWDCAISPYVKDHWHKTSLIKNMFATQEAVNADFRAGDDGVEPAMIHGIKGESGLDLARLRLGVGL